MLVRAEHVLPQLFDRVVTARVVVEKEMSDPDAPEPVRRRAASPPSWLEVKEPTRIEAIPALGKAGVRDAEAGEERLRGVINALG